MKRKSRFMATALACALTLSMAVPAFAADGNGDGYDDTTSNYIGGQTITGTPDTDIKGGTQEIYKTGNGRAVPFIGVIQPTQIKATIPTQVVFDLDPTIDVANLDPETNSQWYAQVTNPSNLKVANNSTVPMYVYVSNVTASVTEGTAITLTNDPADLTTARAVMFGLTSTAEAVGAAQTLGADPNHWMVPKDGATDTTVKITQNYDKDGDGTATDNEMSYVLNPAKASFTGNPSKVSQYDAVAAGADLRLWVNCASVTGWTSDDVFTVMPTIIVSAKDPDVTPVYTANTVVAPGTDVVDPNSTVATPVFNVAAGTITAASTVEITCATAGAKIHYTVDGSTPSASSTEYTGAITINATQTIRAIAVKTGLDDSAVAVATYTVATP